VGIGGLHGLAAGVLRVDQGGTWVGFACAPLLLRVDIPGQALAEHGMSLLGMATVLRGDVWQAARVVLRSRPDEHPGPAGRAS
jgi:hypothetical protein